MTTTIQNQSLKIASALVAGSLLGAVHADVGGDFFSVAILMTIFTYGLVFLAAYPEENSVTACGLKVFLVLFCSALIGCSRSAPRINVVDFMAGERDGFTTLEFDKWLLVFEAIPAQPGYAGSKGGFNYPVTGGSGSSESTFGALKIKQSWDSQANTISVNGQPFTLTDGGKKLAFDDRAYEVEDTPKIILIAKDGKTREQTSK